MTDKPTVFVASSSEAESVAEAVFVKLESEARVKLWSDAFNLSSVTISELIQRTKSADYAVFVLHPDDKTTTRGEEYASARDNVLLELGMFIGAIGLERCFVLAPESKANEFRLPSDLAGVTLSFYDDSDTDCPDAVTGSCAKIKTAIRKIQMMNDEREAPTEIDLLKRQLSEAQSELWRLRHDLQTAQDHHAQLDAAVKSLFFSVAQPATPAEIKAWEDGAKESHLQEVKIGTRSVFFVDRDVVVPAMFGAHSISLIVASGVKLYGIDRKGHNNIYYMDGFRADA